MHACMSLASLTVRTAYLREVAWLDIVVRMPEMVLTQPGRAQGCIGEPFKRGHGGVFQPNDSFQPQRHMAVPRKLIFLCLAVLYEYVFETWLMGGCMHAWF